VAHPERVSATRAAQAMERERAGLFMVVGLLNTGSIRRGRVQGFLS
jgi:hypothetical protein